MGEYKCCITYIRTYTVVVDGVRAGPQDGEPEAGQHSGSLFFLGLRKQSVSRSRSTVSPTIHHPTAYPTYYYNC